MQVYPLGFGVDRLCDRMNRLFAALHQPARIKFFEKKQTSFGRKSKKGTANKYSETLVDRISFHLHFGTLTGGTSQGGE